MAIASTSAGVKTSTGTRFGSGFGTLRATFSET
jgi:hypothetical protein